MLYCITKLHDFQKQLYIMAVEALGAGEWDREKELNQMIVTVNTVLAILHRETLKRF